MYHCRNYNLRKISAGLTQVKTVKNLIIIRCTTDTCNYSVLLHMVTSRANFKSLIYIWLVYVYLILNNFQNCKRYKKMYSIKVAWFYELRNYPVGFLRNVIFFNWFLFFFIIFTNLKIPNLSKSERNTSVIFLVRVIYFI